MASFGSELKRRKVYHVALAYVSAGTVIATAVAELHPHMGLPDWTPRLVLVLLLAGLPVALVLAWAYEVRPEEPSNGDAPATGGEPAGASEIPAAVLSDSSTESLDPSIVVLPFENMSPDASDAYLADGLSQEITTDLTGIRALRVISRTSASQYRSTSKDARTIARELSVRYVLEGSVRKVGDKLRIAVQLIDASRDAHLWAEKYSGTMEQIFELQERVAGSIVETLSIRLSAGEQRRLTEHAVSDVRAFELYLKARQEIYSFTEEGLETARGALERALAVEGENAAILGQLAHVHYQFWNVGIRLREEDLERAREYAERARRLEPASADHRFILGLLEATGGDALRALDHLGAALAINPAHPDALAWYPLVTCYLGMAEQARPRLDELSRIDPLNPFNFWLPITLELHRGRFDQALALAEQERASGSPYFMIEFDYAWALAATHRGSEAAAVIRDASRDGRGLLGQLGLVMACAWTADRQGALRLLDDDLERWARKDFVFSLWMAEALALVGETERALDWLSNAVDHGNVNYAYISERDPFLDSLRGIKQFNRIAERARTRFENWNAEPGEGQA